jgi:hypothetical protein
LDEILKISVNLKDKIENEIISINELYDKINKEVTESFQIKHETLIKKENEIKEKLKNEVAKNKEQLENLFSELNKVIKSSQKILKGIKTLEKENEKDKNMIKILSYVSKINSNKKEIKSILQKPFKKLKISFHEKQSEINFNEYYINIFKDYYDDWFAKHSKDNQVIDYKPEEEKLDENLRRTEVRYCTWFENHSVRSINHVKIMKN